MPENNMTAASEESKSAESMNVAAPSETISENADAVNRRNAESSTGKVTDDGRGAVFFTSADVRAMSRLEVRANLDRILKSMESPDF